MRDNKDFIIIIPARLKSSRLPNKLLIKIGNETVLKRVWLRCQKAVDKKKFLLPVEIRKF